MVLTISLSSFYIVIVILVCIRIILDSSTPSKSLAYLLLVVSIPVIGMIFYLSVGLNYRKRKLYNKKIEVDKYAFPELEQEIAEYSARTLLKKKASLTNFHSLASFLQNKHLISDHNSVELLINGEQKFPKIINALMGAKNHIHLEYYIYENDEIGNQIADILIAKVREGVRVRFIYDDFGSQNIRRNIVKRLQNSGVEIYPFYKINLVQFANRINYRNHRKIIVIDGTVGFIGGINVSDKYINQPKSKLFWRDTHLKIVGPAVLSLQYTFLTDWNFCAKQNISFSQESFPLNNLKSEYGKHSVQIISSGPDSDYPNIMYSLIQLILLAKKEVNITTPYFIPDKAFIDAIKIAVLSGVKVKLLIPGISDSFFINLTSQSHYQDLLNVGVEIYKYNKGFVHAKTIVCDGMVSVVGTANLDNRSFDLNFETNAIVYSEILANELLRAFNQDLKDTKQILLSEWTDRPYYIKLAEKLLHLFSPLM